MRNKNKEWSEFIVAADRAIRVYESYIEPIKSKHGIENLSTANLIFLISIGDGESKVNDLVRQGRYKSSNTSYALKALETAGLLQRRLDEQDRRNALVSLTEKGRALIKDIRSNSIDTSNTCKEVWRAISSFDNHCAKSAVI